VEIGVKKMSMIQKYFIENNDIKTSGEFTEENKGTVIYEVLRITDGKPLFLEAHLERMDNSFKIINRENPFKGSDIKKAIEKLTEINSVTEGNVKITVEIAGKTNILRVYFIPHSYPTEEQYKNGVKTILYFGERKNPNAKIVNNDFRNAVNEKIREAEAYEAILVDRDGNITEGSKSNIFLVKGNTVITSPLEAVLPGVTRGEIIELCKENGINFREEKVNFKELNDMNGLFISGTSPKILPISQVDEMKYDSSNNTLIKELMKYYQEKTDNYIKK